MASHSHTKIDTIFITGLQNAHALEHQALALIDRQLDRLVRYPEVADRLRAHRIETEHQIGRLDEIMSGFGATRSSVKDAVLGFMGNMAALGHALAADEILKNSFANVAFENYEIASYTSLISLAEAGSHSSALQLLQATLEEERAMASWMLETLPDLTLKYAGFRSEGRSASH